LSKIKVLQVIRQGKIGGGESHVIDVVRYLDKHRFEVEVLSFTDGPMVETLAELGIKCHVIHTERPFDFLIWRKVSVLIRKLKVDIIHAHGTRATSNVFSSAKSLGLPLIYTVHGWSFHSGQSVLVKKLRVLSEKFLLKVADQVINVSNSNRRSGVNCLGNYKSVVICNGIDLGKFDFSISKDYDLLESMGIDPTKTIIGAINRITYQKNPEGLIRGFHQAIKQKSNIHLLVVGDGEMLESAKSLVKELKLSSNVTFAGSRKGVPELLAAIDIFCLASFWEGLSLGLLEAMAMKKAIVATQVDGTSEVLQHESNGLLFEPGDDQSLGSLIVKLVEDSGLRSRLGENAFELIQENHEAAAMVKLIENEYLILSPNATSKEESNTQVY
jgi:glycosyltransferase involved in cell wall biosynthesis